MNQVAAFVRRRWKLLLNIITIGALIILVIALRSQLVETFANLARVKAWALLLLIPIEALNYHAQTKTYQALFRTAGNALSYKSLMKISLELNFVNHVFPSGGVSGISYFGLRLRGAGVRATAATLVQMMKLILLTLSFEVLLIIGLFILAVNGRASNLVILIGGSVSTLLIIATATFAFIIGSRRRINAFFLWVTKAINKLIQFFRPKHPETLNLNKAREIFDELHENYLLFKTRYRELKQPFWYSLLANATEILAIYVVFVAFGQWINVGAVILAYAVANVAGLISVLPGGVGIYEALMTAVLATAGVPAALSIPATIMYRVLNTLIQVPPGYVLYHRSLQEGTSGSAKR